MQFDVRHHIANSITQRWKLLLSEFEVVLIHKIGSNNTTAGFLSRLSEWENKKLKLLTHETLLNKHETLLTHLKTAFSLESIQNLHRTISEDVKQKLKLTIKTITDFTILVDSKQKTFIPENSSFRILTLYHLLLVHLGENRLCYTINSYYFVPDAKVKIHLLTGKCKDSQRFKQNFK